MTATEHIATDEEIATRVEQNDIPLTAKRAAAAQQIGELARNRAVIAAQLEDIERKLSDVLAGAQDVITVDELARFTRVPAADLRRWLEARPTTRTKRKRSVAAGDGTNPRSAKASRAEQETTRPNPAEAPAAAAGLLARVPAAVGT